MLKKGKLKGDGGLSVNSVRQHRTVLMQAFNFALKNRVISSNPVHGAELGSQERYEADFYSLEEAKELLSVCDNDILRPILLLTLYYGLRRSEVLGLKWSAIDFKKGTLAIKHTVVKHTTLVRKNKTKNTSSRRSFPLIDFIIPELKAIKDQQDSNKKMMGEQYFDSEYVFLWPDGRPISPDYTSQAFKKLLKKHNLREIRFHDLRHSCASILYSLGFGLKDIQEWLGHSDIKMTANIYAHLETRRKMEMASTFANNLNTITAG